MHGYQRSARWFSLVVAFKREFFTKATAPCFALDSTGRYELKSVLWSVSGMGLRTSQSCDWIPPFRRHAVKSWLKVFQFCFTLTLRDSLFHRVYLSFVVSRLTYSILKCPCSAVVAVIRSWKVRGKWWQTARTYIKSAAFLRFHIICACLVGLFCSNMLWFPFLWSRRCRIREFGGEHHSYTSTQYIRAWLRRVRACACDGVRYLLGSPCWSRTVKIRCVFYVTCRCSFD
jgi:hypothetical protein